MKNWNLPLFSLAIFLSLAPTCEPQNAEKTEKLTKNQSTELEKTNQPYAFNAPDQTLALPMELNEISGLSATPNPNELAAVHDELGDIFFIDKKTGAILRRINFTADGDFEGLEFVEKDLYVVKSKGTIYKISHLGATNQIVEKLGTSLSKTDNIEGLTYDPVQKHLLLAAKGQKMGETVKKIHRFDLQKREILGGGEISISLTDFQDFLKKKRGKNYEKLKSDYENATDNLELGLSGIAVHPQSGEWYLVSSVNKILLRLTPNGKIIDMFKLDKTVHRQPEGLCFGADGTLFISNEAKDGNPPTLLVFKKLF